MKATLNRKIEKELKERFKANTLSQFEKEKANSNQNITKRASSYDKGKAIPGRNAPGPRRVR